MKMEKVVYLPHPWDEKSYRVAVALSPDGRTLALQHDYEVAVQDVSDPEAPGAPVLLPRLEKYGALAFSPQGELFCGSQRWSQEAGQWELVLAHPDADYPNMGQPVWLKDGRVLLSSGYGRLAGGAVYGPVAQGAAHLLTTEDKEVCGDVRPSAAPDCAMVAFGGSDWVQIYDVDAGKYRKRLPRQKVYHGTWPVWTQAGLFHAGNHPDALPLPGRNIARVTQVGRKGKTQFPEVFHFDLKSDKTVRGVAAAGDALLVLLTETAGAQAELCLWSISGQALVQRLVLEGDFEGVWMEPGGQRAVVRGDYQVALVLLGQS